ncbi:hypothetical protein WKW50_16355 [Ochrobactrum sp. GPK 3]
MNARDPNKFTPMMVGIMNAVFFDEYPLTPLSAIAKSVSYRLAEDVSTGRVKPALDALVEAGWIRRHVTGMGMTTHDAYQITEGGRLEYEEFLVGLSKKPKRIVDPSVTPHAATSMMTLSSLPRRPSNFRLFLRDLSRRIPFMGRK